MDLRLKVVGGELERSEVDLVLPATLGRGSEASLRLVHPLVSRLHCEIFERDGQVWVRDLQSLNGTFVGSERVHEWPLRPGDLLTVGVVTFRAGYRLPDVAPKADRTAGSTGTDDAGSSRGENGGTGASINRKVIRPRNAGAFPEPAGDTEPLATDLSPLPPVPGRSPSPGNASAQKEPDAAPPSDDRTSETADERF